MQMTKDQMKAKDKSLAGSRIDGAMPRLARTCESATPTASTVA
jgi:hypothetical protein